MANKVTFPAAPVDPAGVEVRAEIDEALVGSLSRYQTTVSTELATATMARRLLCDCAGIEAAVGMAG
ncbi:hypothetical protein [Actinomadura fulvescens]|uniref:hypothetical protein n=1 Tax=Actinomadura fulvescens TaxID=46160 RepID=UPI0031E2145C